MVDCVLIALLSLLVHSCRIDSVFVKGWFASWCCGLCGGGLVFPDLGCSWGVFVS